MSRDDNGLLGIRQLKYLHLPCPSDLRQKSHTLGSGKSVTVTLRPSPVRGTSATDLQRPLYSSFVKFMLVVGRTIFNTLKHMGNKPSQLVFFYTRGICF